MNIKIKDMSFILISDATKITGLDRQTIRNWMEKGIIPYKKINGTFYVDNRVFKRLSSEMNDVAGTKQRLDDLQREYLDEIASYREMRERNRFEHNTERLLSICVNSGVRTRFFDSMVSAMGQIGILKDKEVEVLSSLLNGDAFEEVAKRCDTSRERIRQIAEKAIHKSNDLSKLIERLNTIDEKEDEIRALKMENEVLKKMVYKQAIGVNEAEMSETERRLVRMGRKDLNALLSTKLVDEELTVRALNCLCHYKNENNVTYRIETLGELCRISKDDFFKQRSVGKKTLDEISEYLQKKGLEWGLDIDKIISMT